MAESVKGTKRHQGVLQSRIPDELIDQAAAMQAALEPDPAADPIARIDQEWVKESSRYAVINGSGVLEPPSRARLLALVGVAGLLGPGLIILGLALGERGFALIGGFSTLFFGLPMLLVLRTAGKYSAAAAAYRQRRAAALASLGRPADAAGPLPVVDAAVWVGKGLVSLEKAITRLHDQYGFSNIGAREYERTRAALLAEAPAEEQAFYQELMALEHDWALQRRKLAVSREDDSGWRVPPSAARARLDAIVGVAPLVIAAALATQSVSPIFLGCLALLGLLLLIDAWSDYRKSGRYERAQAEYRQRREDLLARRR
ncbi:MAG TPA: hypothetical protein VD886_14010 [Herpetosiphonaceae bacterium]|nr:hypothetical protein [Herpetosiphonaceae bacterium]